MDQLLEWPSKRIPHGGVFHYPKVKYSPETHDMLKTLMNESKLTLRQQKQVDWCLRSGSSLSDAKNRSKPLRVQSAPICSKNPPKISRRRSYFEIKNSGDFERERFIPNQKNEDREVIKNRLQEIMEYGKDQDYLIKIPKLKPEKKTNIQEKKLPGKYEILQDLLLQIKERSEWLEEMETLGEGVKHREVIHHQIAERMRKIDSLNLPKNIMKLKIDDDESSNSEKINDKDLDSSKITGRNDKKPASGTNFYIKKTNTSIKDLEKNNMNHKEHHENIADILYPA